VKNANKYFLVNIDALAGFDGDESSINYDIELCDHLDMVAQRINELEGEADFNSTSLNYEAVFVNVARKNEIAAEPFVTDCREIWVVESDDTNIESDCTVKQFVCADFTFYCFDTESEALNFIREADMAGKIAVGFNEKGRASFREWFERATGRGINDAQIQNYFHSNEYKNFETGENLSIEVSKFDTTSGNPELYLIDTDEVEFAEG